MSRADDLVLAHLAGQRDAASLDGELRREQVRHPEEVTAALMLLRLHGLMRGDAVPVGLSGRIQERVRRQQWERIRDRVMTAVRFLPVFRVHTTVRRLALALAALLVLGLGLGWWLAVGNDSGIQVVAGAWLADGRVVTAGRLPRATTGQVGDAGLTLRWSDGSEAQIAAGGRLHLSDGTLAVDAGTLRCAVAPHRPGHPFRITTPHASVEVLGTRFTLTVAEATTCRVEQGAVSFRSGAQAVRIEAGAVMTSTALSEHRSDGWRLVWADEFDHSGTPDPGRWREWRRRTGSQGDIQVYLPERAHIADGCLHLEARKDPIGWTAPSLMATDLVLRPGMRIELRARMPDGTGIWPLVWGVDATRWPQGAEVVFLSTTGDPPRLRWSLRDDQDMQMGMGPQVVRGFHTYAITWTDAGLACTRDGVDVGTRPAPTHAGWAASITGGLSLALELAVTKEAAVSAPTRQLDIDWLRVYQVDGGKIER